MALKEEVLINFRFAYNVADDTQYGYYPDEVLKVTSVMVSSKHIIYHYPYAWGLDNWLL